MDHPQINPESWWRDPLADEIGRHLEHLAEDNPSRFGGKADSTMQALVQLELLLQAKLIRQLIKENYEFSPLVMGLAEIIHAAEEFIKKQAISALSK